MERLEVTEKKRSEQLSQNKEVLLSKLELEATLKHERRKMKEVLDGKGNAVLREKITALETKLAEMSISEKQVKTKERAQQKKVDESNNLLELVKTDLRTKVEVERKQHETRIDKMKLELTECWLNVDELRSEVKQWKDKYEILREGME